MMNWLEEGRKDQVFLFILDLRMACTFVPFSRLTSVCRLSVMPPSFQPQMLQRWFSVEATKERSIDPLYI